MEAVGLGRIDTSVGHKHLLAIVVELMALWQLLATRHFTVPSTHDQVAHWWVAVMALAVGSFCRSNEAINQATNDYWESTLWEQVIYCSLTPSLAFPRVIGMHLTYGRED